MISNLLFDHLSLIVLQKIGLTILISIILLWSTRIIHNISNKFFKMAWEETNPEGVRRARTLGSVLENLFRILIVALLFIEILRHLQINLTSIFVSFSIVGTILGLGSQSIVKDLVNGLFLLIENQFGVGDIISVDNKHTGTVENMTLRITMLRDMEGKAHYISNGKISEVIVLSKEFARAMVDIEVNIDEDINKVINILSELGLELAESLDSVQEPTEVLGIEKITPVSYIVRTLTKTAPGQQWLVARELRKRIIIRFNKEGFSKPITQQLVWNSYIEDVDNN